MQRFVLLFACVLACAAFLPREARSDNAIGAAGATPPPEIYHVVTSALCARLHERVRPAVAMILQNDEKIAKSPPLFKKYQQGTLTGFGQDTAQNGDSIYTQTPETRMALQQMSYLVIPIARNIIAAQTLLDDVKLVEPTGNPNDDAKLAQIKRQLLETIAYQSASLDIINGFVQTLQMGDLQHAGEEYLSEMQGQDLNTSMARETPNPWQDPNTPGLAPNPYSLNVEQIPGLSVGYNPLGRIVEGLTWLQEETQKREDVA
ncbi:MAG: hypothetical protein JO146_05020, partial [Candidatus Eremiobacteraeota bacterium]|nr:hypothetical protein [Candidatus Eremiobacteraeota bacterium]